MKKLLVLALIILYNFSLNATNIYVTNTSDSGIGSLREAVLSANSIYGTDNIIFDIPLSDDGFNPLTGVWTITLLSPLPYLMTGYKNFDATTQTQNQGNTNLLGPEIMLKCDSMLDYSFALVSPGNSIKGFVINGFNYGILLYNSTATNNTISECYFGTDHTGTIAGIPNENGISIANAAANNNIINNLISGSTNAGIAAMDAGGNNIRGNIIGTDITGTIPIPNMYGIGMENTPNNVIGGNTPAQRNLISGNSFAGIGFNGTGSINNVITGNYIGTDITGTQALPNDHGIILSYASSTTIGGAESDKRNIISGNTSAGIVMNGTGTRNNIVIGNYVGTDISGLQPISNYAGIILKSKSNSNIIGGNTIAERNIISANIEMGIYVEASDSNIIIGNYIGPDVTGLTAFKTGDTLLQANGIEFNTVSKYNRLGGYNAAERNVISGNRVYGMVYYGNVSYNPVIGNYIGVDATGNNPLPNATGICVDGGSNNNPIINNVLSGNISYGIFIVTTGSNYNEFKGNIVGLNAAGTDTVPNESGLLIGGGTKYNMIGGSSAQDRNVFSGNRFAGIIMADVSTKFNTIKGNYIGTDISGMISKANYYGFSIISKAAENTIDSNVVSGNTGFGFLLENADSNYFYNNLIGVASDKQSALGNGAAGMILYAGSEKNIIGAQGKGNTIAFHDTCGILIMDNNTMCNTISANSIYNNNYLDIEIFPPGINNNDAGDTDTGPNHLMNFPVITNGTFNPQTAHAWITGSVDTENPQNCKVEIFIAEPNYLNHGGAKTYIGYAVPDATGYWDFYGQGINEGDIITTTATNACGSTSEFSEVFTVILNTHSPELPEYDVHIYPNPASDYLTFETNYAFEEIIIFDVMGKQILMNKEVLSNRIYVNDLKPGVYFIVFRNNDRSFNKRFVKN